MTNVVSLSRTHVQTPEIVADNTSPILFEAYERPLYYEGKYGNRFEDTKHKALVRYDAKNDKPVCLNVVGEKYKVVQNAELFNKVHEGLRTQLTPREITSAEIIDRVAMGGQRCFREYRFRGIDVPSPESDRIGFRVIIENGFGTGAIKIHAGAIDFFCTNGMILGDFTSMYAKHTSGLEIIRFKEHVEMCVNVFWKNKDLWSTLRDKKLASDDSVHEWLKDQFSKALGTKLFHQYLVECRVRGGRNMWALYSALTHFASHARTFPVRETGNDHLAHTMMQREHKVRNVFNASQMFSELAA